MTTPSTSRARILRASFLAPAPTIAGLTLRPLSAAVLELAQELKLSILEQSERAEPMTSTEKLRELSAVFFLLTQPPDVCREAVYSGKFFEDWLPDFAMDLPISALLDLAAVIGSAANEIAAASVRTEPQGEPDPSAPQPPGNS